MKQVLQDLKTGMTLVEEAPAPLDRHGHVRIATTVSLVSPGTERTVVEFARAGWISKARQQPEKVRQAIDKVRTEGLGATIEAITAKLDQPLALGYCNVGRVLSAPGTTFSPGDRVVSNGKHAEVVVVPRNLCARAPDNVSDEEAAFTVLGAIALQGVRLAGPTLGESFVVMGLGLIGLLAVQLLRANGCRVLAIDSAADRLTLARGFGAETVDLSRGEDTLASASAFSRGEGVDGVLLTLSSDSDEPVSQAARICRKRGRVVLVGVTGLNLNRNDFYEREISLQVSCSYGPGRYDPDYEEHGRDYPLGFVRWTEQRNFEAVLQLMSSGQLDVRPLISHRFPVADAAKAYDLVAASDVPSLGVLLQYSGPKGDPPARAPATSISLGQATSGAPAVSVIGAGNYSSRVLIPAFAAGGAQLRTLVSAEGLSAVRHGRKHGFSSASSDALDAIADPEVQAVCVATRHDSHARYVTAALEAGKHVFVEKPIALDLGELEEVAAAAGRSPSLVLMVGFNRRFAPMVRAIKALIDQVREPKMFLLTINAGAIPANHWSQDPTIGGGRLLGEACHGLDLLRHLAGAPFADVAVTGLSRPAGPPRTDVASLTLKFADGSVGVINYLANGHRAFPKERLEIFCADRVLVLENFRRLRGYGWPGFRPQSNFTADKGQRACVAAFLAAVRGEGEPPIPLSEILEVGRVSIEVAERAGG